MHMITNPVLECTDVGSSESNLFYSPGKEVSKCTSKPFLTSGLNVIPLKSDRLRFTLEFSISVDVKYFTI